MYEELIKRLRVAARVGDAPIGEHWGTIITKSDAALAADIIEALNAEVPALRAQQEAEKSKPLTREELLKMGLHCEGVYVAHIDGSPVFRDQTYCAAVLDVPTAVGKTGLPIHAIYGDKLIMWGDEYGKTWLAYRRKPGNNAAPVPQLTNGDRLRSMSDEELAAFTQEPFCDKRTTKECKITYSGVCYQCVLDWLKQPAEVET